MEDSSNRKPSRLDHFCDGPDESKPYRWEEFASATPAFNKDQKPVVLSKDRRLWYYLGRQSTESKAQYTGNPAKPFNDPTSNFLQSVEPARRPLITQPQPARRQSLPASYPRQHPASVNVPSANAPMTAPRPTYAERSEQQKIDDYQRRMAILGSSAGPVSPSQYHSNHRAANNQSPVIAYSGQSGNEMGQLPADLGARDAQLLRQKAILDRSQQRAMVLDQQDRPYNYKPKFSMPPPNIGIDTQSVERQREFQRRAYQQSLHNAQLSSHSPGMESGFITDGQNSQWDQYVGVERGTGYVSSQSSPNTARYGNASPSPTEAAFPLLRRPQQQSISSSSTDRQHNNYPSHPQSISSQQQSPTVNFFDNQHRFPQTTFAYPQQSPLSQISSSSNRFSMSSPERTAPIDIPGQLSNTSTAMRNRGQHTADFIDPNLMQLNQNDQDRSVYHSGTNTGQTTRNNTDQNRADQATRSMPPPPIPASASASALTSPVAATNVGMNYFPQYTYADIKTSQLGNSDNSGTSGAIEARHRPKSFTFAALPTDVILADMKTRYPVETEQRPLRNDKPIPQAIASLRQVSGTRRSSRISTLRHTATERMSVA